MKVQNAGKPIKILIKKQLCSTNVQPPFSKKQIIWATILIKRQQSKIH